LTNKRATGIIRPALPQDAADAAPLIVETGYETIEIAFGSLAKGRQILTRMFQKPNNIHSYEFGTVYELEGQLLGLLMGYGCEQERKTFVPSALFFLRHRGLHIGGLFRIQGMIGKIEPNTYYVHVLSVTSDMRSKGVGTILMQEAERIACKSSKTKISLLVESRNKRAIRFYQKQGYQIIESRIDKTLLKRRGFRGYVKMAKGL